MSKVACTHPGSIITALLCVIAGCSSGGDGETNAAALTPSEFGTVSIPLATQFNGVFYRLGGTFTYSGASEGTLSQNGSGTLQFAVLAPGDYDITLADGWTLTREEAGDSGATAVEAELVTANPVPIRIESGSHEILTYVFSTDGTAVSIEPGTIQVNLDVLDQSNFDPSIFGGVMLDEQAQVDAFAGVQTFGDGVTVTGGGITSLAPLQQANSVGALSIVATSLGTLAGLNSVTTSGDLVISDNPSLTSLSDLESLSATGDISIINNASLPTCEAEALIEHITQTLGGSTGNVEISGNDDSGTCP